MYGKVILIPAGYIKHIDLYYQHQEHINTTTIVIEQIEMSIVIVAHNPHYIDTSNNQHQ